MRKISKKNKDEISSQVYKLLLNSLYGRLGLQKDKPTPFIIPSINKDDVLSMFKFKNYFDYGNYTYVEITSYQLEKLNNDTFRDDSYPLIDKIAKKLKNGEKTFSAVQLASAITSNARCYVYNYLYKNSEKLYYTDTDSMYIECELDSNDVSDNELGKWKFEEIPNNTCSFY